MARLADSELERCNDLRSTEALSKRVVRRNGAALHIETYGLPELGVPNHIVDELSAAVVVMWSAWDPGDMLVEILLIDEPRYEDSDQVRMGFSHPGGIIVLGVSVPALIPWEEWSAPLRLLLGAAHEMMHCVLERQGLSTHEDLPYAEQMEERICWTEAFDLIRAVQPENWPALRAGAAHHEAHWIAVAEDKWLSEGRTAPTASRYIAAFSALDRR